MPLISICLPAYRAERFLAETLASVRAQTLADWELIVTEDGSRDRTEEIVRAFAASVPQEVRYTRHEVNRGLPATRNTGLAAAHGEWLALLDADDLWQPDHLARCLAAAPASGPALVFGGSSVFDSDTGAEVNRREIPADLRGGLPGALFDGRLVIQPAAVLINRTAFALVGGFDPRFPICNDFDYWLRCCRAGVTLAYNGALTLRYRKHPGAMSNKSAALIAETASILLANSRGFPGRSPAEARRAARRRLLDAARIARSGSTATALRYALRAARTLLPL
ncbi:MAG: glycosyltransferase family 2 protein [Opitutaceae bacterium]